MKRKPLTATTRRPLPPALALFGKTRRELLALLFGHAGRDHYLNELVKHVGGSVSQVQLELKRLTESGLILREQRGRQVYFCANPEAAIYHDLRSIITKTFGVADIVREALEPCRERLQFAFIYGSVARNEDTAHSDIDLMLVGDLRLSEIADHIGQAQTRLKREIAPSLYGEREFADKLHKADHFLSSVVAGRKIMLIGTEQDLALLTKPEPAKP